MGDIANTWLLGGNCNHRKGKGMKVTKFIEKRLYLKKALL